MRGHAATARDSNGESFLPDFSAAASRRRAARRGCVPPESGDPPFRRSASCLTASLSSSGRRSRPRQGDWSGKMSAELRRGGAVCGERPPRSR